jgi:hypothetical protein
VWVVEGLVEVARVGVARAAAAADVGATAAVGSVAVATAMEVRVAAAARVVAAARAGAAARAAPMEAAQSAQVAHANRRQGRKRGCRAAAPLLHRSSSTRCDAFATRVLAQE